MLSKMLHYLIYCSAMLLLLFGFTSYSIAGEKSNEFVQQYKPTLHVTRAPGQIEIDGHLSDAGWQTALPATNFTEHSPGEEVKPPVRTEAFVTYDDDNLYLAAVCYADPAQVRASMCERERIFADDNIGFFFDTYGDASRAYIININPHGIQYDAQWSSGWGEDSNFDLVFESAGAITDSGYQVELAIPFASLRFPNKPVQEWRFDFYRHHQREVHYSMSWATYDQDESCWPCQWGTVQGIEKVKPGRGIELLPSFVAHQSSQVTNEVYPDTSFMNGDCFGDFSIGGKYALTSDVVVEAAYNPDFSQIEADASQVDVNTTFALSYEEKRPFFQEGVNLFWTNFNAVYTRSINDPDFATKASATLGRTSIAALSAHDEHSLIIVPFEERSAYVPANRSYTNMFAVRHAFGQDSHIRALVTDRRFEQGGSGTLASLDGGLRLTKSLKLRGQFMTTYTGEPDDEALSEYLPDTTFDSGAHTAAFDGESFTGTAGLVGFELETRELYANVRTYQRTRTYRADNGFQPRNSDRWVVSDIGYQIRPKATIFHRLTPGISFARIWNFDGIRKDEWAQLNFGGQFRFAQAGFELEYLRSRELFGGVDFSSIWGFAGDLWATPVPAVKISCGVDYGYRIARRYLQMGKELAIEFGADLRPTDRLLIQPSIGYMESRDPDSDGLFFSGYILYTKLSYQFSRELSLRLVTEYDNFERQWNVDPLVTYRMNPFSTFYLGATYDYDRFDDCGPNKDRSITCLSERQFFMKIQYLFQT